MSFELRRRAELSSQQLANLEGAMAAFYRNPPAHYYQIADENAGKYNKQERPFHYDLVERVRSGDSMLELGCGTAHLCSPVEGRGGIYSGVDYSETLLEANRRRFPQARFFSMATPLAETFDIVASLYTIEHVVDPLAYLERMWSYCRSGGLLAIICPEFVEIPGLAPSVFFGKTPRRFSEKFKSLNLMDATRHLLDLKFFGPRWQKRARTSPPGAFWINLRPRVLHGAKYDIDGDAVHLVRRHDLVWFLKQKGASILQTSADMPGVSPEILRYNCYVLAKKPDSAQTTVAQ
jgi:SAM-dependent methyltransferase